jgi:hypothetical protein
LWQNGFAVSPDDFFCTNRSATLFGAGKPRFQLYRYSLELDNEVVAPTGD